MKNKTRNILISAILLALVIIFWSSCSDISRFALGQDSEMKSQEQESKSSLEKSNSKKSASAKDNSEQNDNSEEKENYYSNNSKYSKTQSSKNSNTETESGSNGTIPSSFYISAKVGATLTSFDEFDGTEKDYGRLSASFAWGVHLTDSIRTELELGYLAKITEKEVFNDSILEVHNKFEQKITTGMINVYFQLSDNKCFAPYVGFGAGIAHIKTRATEAQIITDVVVDSSKVNDSENAFMASATVGATTQITERTNIDYEVKYSFIDADEDISNVSASIGLRYRF